jgi:heptosyltransferase II
LEVLEKEKILVIQTAFLGDAVLTLPLIQELKKAFPASSIDVVSIPATAELFRHSPAVNEVIPYDKHRNRKFVTDFIGLLTIISRKRYSRVYSPHRSFRSTLISFFSGAGFTTGFDNSALSLLYKFRVKYKPGIHEVARNLQLMDFDVFDQKWRILPELKIPEDTIRKAEEIKNDLGNKNIAAVALGSVWMTKVYPVEYFIEVIGFLRAQNYNVILIGGKQDASLSGGVAGKFNSSVKSFAGILSIVESIALLRHASFLISNDSAPSHLAMIADIPVLTLYCSTVPDFGFFPYNNGSKNLSFNDLHCKPCGIHGLKSCPIETFECGYKLIPEKVCGELSKYFIAGKDTS